MASLGLAHNDEQQVRHWLESQGLTKYADTLVEGGCDTMEVLLNLTEDDLLELDPPIPKMKRGSILRKIRSHKNKSTGSSSSGCKIILDSYHTLDQVQQDLRKAGLEASDMIVGIDFTGSNSWQGRRTFNDGKGDDDWSENLHRLDPAGKVLNPYQQVIAAMGKALSAFDDDCLIPAFGFGDKETSHNSVFCLNSGNKCGEEFAVEAEPCEGFDTVLSKYAARVQDRQLWGKTTVSQVIVLDLFMIRDS